MFKLPKQKSIGLIGLSVLSLFFTISAPEPVYAGCAGCERSWRARDDHNETRTTFNNRIQQLETNLEQALRLQTGQLSGNTREQIAASSNLEQAADERSRQREIERARFQAIQNAETAPSTCKMLTRAMTSNLYGSSMAAERYMQAANTTDKVVSIFLGTGSSVAGQPSTSAGGRTGSTRLAQHFGGRYCSAELAQAGVCSAENLAPAEYQNAHVNALRSILSSDNLEEPEAINACHDFAVANMGRIDGAVDPNFINRTVNSAEAYIDRTAAANRLSLSNSIMSSYCARRTAMPANSSGADDVSVYKTMIDETPAFADLRGKDLSQQAAYRVMSQSFINNPQVIGKQEEALTEKQVLIELYYVLAWMSNQNYELYQVLDKQSLVDAAQLQALNEMLLLQKQGAIQ